MTDQKRWRRRTVVLTLLVACLCWQVVGGSVGATVTGQSGEEYSGIIAQQADPNNSTRVANTTTEVGNGTAGGEAGGAVGSGMIDVSGQVMGAIGAFVDELINVGGGAVDTLNSFVFQVPAPGTVDDPQSWLAPTGGVWQGVVGALPYTVGLAVVMLAGAVGVSFMHSDERSRRAAWKRCAIATGALLLGIVVPAVVLHSGNAIALALAPESGEFFSTPESFGQLGVGVGLGLVLAITQTAAVGAALIVLALERMLIYMTVYLWPLAWACYAYTGFVRSLGQTIIYTFGVVVATKVVQALVVRLLFEIPLWTGDTATSVTSFAMTVAGLVFALIIFPKNMLDHANDAATVSLGVSAAPQKGGEYMEASMKRAYVRLQNDPEDDGRGT